MTNIINGKRLIGQTINFRARFGRYNSELVRNRYFNTYLQNSYNKYGTDNFKMELVCLCSKENLTEMESFYCKAFNTFDKNFGYNLKEPTTHVNMSEESRKRRSESMMGQQRSLGYRHTDEAKKAIAESSRNRKSSVGHVLSEEHKNKISD